MVKYYADSEEKYLKSVVLYAVEKEFPDSQESGPILCHDEEGTMTVSISEAKNLFFKNLMLVDISDLGCMSVYHPIKIEEPVNPVNGYNILSIILGDGTDPVRCFEEADLAITSNPPSENPGFGGLTDPTASS